MVVTIHCGSRGLGHQICSDHVKTMLKAMPRYGIDVPDRQLACAPVDSPEGTAYMGAMAAAAFAQQPAAPKSDPANTLVIELKTGPVLIQLRPDLAPKHVERIKLLAREKFYDGIVFHRVIEGFMAQTGCPHGTGTGGSGQKLKAEFNAEPHVRGTVSIGLLDGPSMVYVETARSGDVGPHTPDIGMPIP